MADAVAGMALEDAVLQISQETLERLGHFNALERERRVEVVEHRGPQFIGNDGRDHASITFVEDYLLPGRIRSKFRSVGNGASASLK